MTPAKLGELGARIEYGIHNAMHERFGGWPTVGHPRGNRTDALNRPTSKWNNPGYDTLLDSYSAHVHPWFWKIHGWVDSCLAKWERLNDCQLMWDTWMGGMPHHDHGHHHPKPQESTLVAAVEFLTKAGMSGAFRPLLYVPHPGGTTTMARLVGKPATKRSTKKAGGSRRKAKEKTKKKAKRKRSH
jgi:hypothetical protein